MPEVYVSLKLGVTTSHKVVAGKVVAAIETMIGKIARPKTVQVVPGMSKTRSGKLTRRVLAAISSDMNVGDVTTLANPDAAEQARM